MSKFLIIGPRLTYHFGGPSVILGLTRALREQVKNCQISLACVSPDHERERIATAQHGLGFINLPSGFKNRLSMLAAAILMRFYPKLSIGSKSVRRFLCTVRDSDVVIVATAIGSIDGEKGIRGIISYGLSNYAFGLAKLFRKPTVQYTSDFGPLRQFWNRTFTKFWLGQFADIIICRSSESRRWLTDIGISTEKLMDAPDCGFLFEAARSQKIESLMKNFTGAPLVGFGVSFQVRKRFSDPLKYDRLVKSFIRYLTNDQGYYVLLIPNETHPQFAQKDDLQLATRITKELDNNLVSFLDTNTFSASEVKSAIGNCEVVVSSRYHTLLACLSMGVPCIGIGWHHKYEAMFRMFEMQNWTLHFSQCNEKNLIETFDNLFNERHNLKKTILQNLPAVEKAIRCTASKVCVKISELAPGRIQFLENQKQ